MYELSLSFELSGTKYMKLDFHLNLACFHGIRARFLGRFSSIFRQLGSVYVEGFWSFCRFLVVGESKLLLVSAGHILLGSAFWVDFRRFGLDSGEVTNFGVSIIRSWGFDCILKAVFLR